MTTEATQAVQLGENYKKARDYEVQGKLMTHLWRELTQVVKEINAQTPAFEYGKTSEKPRVSMSRETNVISINYKGLHFDGGGDTPHYEGHTLFTVSPTTEPGDQNFRAKFESFNSEKTFSLTGTGIKAAAKYLDKNLVADLSDEERLNLKSIREQISTEAESRVQQALKV